MTGAPGNGGPRLRAVLFDAVGTLIELREPVGATYARIGAEFGARASAARLEDAFARVVGEAGPLVFPGEPLARAAELEKEGWRRRVDDTFRAADGAALPRPFAACFERLFAHYASAEAWSLRPGAEEALVAIRSRGLATGIVSNFDQRLRPLLAALGVHHLFHAIVLPADVGAAKPDRAIFDAALKRLGLGGEDVAYVGDRAVSDVAASRAAGLRPIDVAALANLHELPRALGLARGPEGS
jgi:putative hydrolase of the HAD superfamily